MYQTLKCMQSHLYMGKLNDFTNCLLNVFQHIGTKTINNMAVTLYGNPKQNYWKHVFSVFYVKNAKTDANRPIWRNRKTLPKRYILSIFELVTNKKKKREYRCKALYIRKQKHITRNVYNEYFIVSQEPRSKKHKN